MDQFIFDGKYYQLGDPVINAGNRGLRYGDGLFETIKLNKGQLILADEHFARLWNGMQVLQFDIPKHFTPDKLGEEVLALCKKNGHGTIARVRVTVCRGNGGLYDATDHFPHYMIETWELIATEGLNSNGLVLGIYEEVKKSRDILSNLKHNNFLPYVMGALHAKKQKWNDAVILNSGERVCDSTIANIFLIKDGIISTPALSEACVAGVTRKHLLHVLNAGGYHTIEKEITVQELLDADEVFLTNSIRFIRWVQRIGEKEYANSVVSQIYTAFIQTIS